MTEATIGLTYKPKSTLFDKIYTFSKSSYFRDLSGVFWIPTSSLLLKISIFSKCPFFKISTFHDSFTTFLNTKIFKFCENLHFFLSKSPFSWNLRIQEYSWKFFWSLNLKYPHLSLLEIRKGWKGVVKSSINLQKIIYNWPREGRRRGHYHIHGRL